jgi:hypothetical protein
MAGNNRYKVGVTGGSSVVRTTFSIPEDIYHQFIIKLKREGYTIQDGITLLIQNYTEGRFDIDESM